MRVYACVVEHKDGKQGPNNGFCGKCESGDWISQTLITTLPGAQHIHKQRLPIARIFRLVVKLSGSMANQHCNKSYEEKKEFDLPFGSADGIGMRRTRPRSS